MLMSMHVPAATVSQMGLLMGGETTNSTMASLMSEMSPSARPMVMSAMPVSAGQVAAGTTVHFAFATFLGLAFAAVIGAAAWAGIPGMRTSRRPVHQDPGCGAGPPPVLGRDARCHAGAAGGDLLRDRGADRAGIRGGLLLGGAGHDQLRHVHRHRQRQGPDRAAGQGQAETLRPAAGRARPGRDPGRRDPADLARLSRRPAGRHPVPGHDRPAEDPVRGGVRYGRAVSGGRGHDRGLRRRPELRGELRAPGGNRAALHRVSARPATART